MQQEIASAVLKKTTYLISKYNIAEAARVMGKTLSPEVIDRLASLHGCEYANCGPLVLSYLADLGKEILTLA